MNWSRDLVSHNWQKRKCEKNIFYVTLRYTSITSNISNFKTLTGWLQHLDKFQTKQFTTFKDTVQTDNLLYSFWFKAHPSTMFSLGDHKNRPEKWFVWSVMLQDSFQMQVLASRITTKQQSVTEKQQTQVWRSSATRLNTWLKKAKHISAR